MKKISFLLIALLFVFAATSVSAMTASKLRAEQDSMGNWKLISMPRATLESKQYKDGEKAGYFTIVLTCRKKGVWDNPLLLGHPLDEQRARVMFKKLKKITNFFNVQIAQEERIAIGYWVDFEEIVIYIPNKYKNQEWHEKIVEMFNKHRKENVK